MSTLRATSMRFATLAAGLWTMAAAPAFASGLQVAPVTVTFAQDKSSDVLTLSNTGDDVVHVQVRTYHWTQDGTGDRLDPTTDLAVSPPMITLQPGEKQLIRVIRRGSHTGAGGAEDAFRIKIDELPVDQTGENGLRYVLNYSLPIFVQPASGAVAAPQLQWRLVEMDHHVALEAVNNGTQHAQVADVTYRNAAGASTQLAPGLLGYVLPGSTMRWATALPLETLTSGGALLATINGQPVTQTLSIPAPAH